MSALIAKKIGMTQIFDENSNALGVTVGRKPLPVISPGYEYHKGRTFPVWEEVQNQKQKIQRRQRNE